MSDLYATLDIDWAPDWTIDAAADVLEAAGCRATWFVTHDSPALERLRSSELFELGVHPNFLPGSTHGSEAPEILRHVLEIVPQARCVRTHGAHQSGAIVSMLADSQLELDCSVMLPGLSWSEPSRHQTATGGIWRVPYLWSDDYEARMSEPVWDLDGRFAVDGIKIVDFHPMHVALNSKLMSDYEELKTDGSVAGWSEERIAASRQEGEGAGTLFSALVERLGADAGGATMSALIPDGPA